MAHARPEPHGAVVSAPWVRNERAATAGLKTTSYAENVIALAHAKERGALEAVFGNTRGELCEATGSNVFVVVDGVLRTPPLDSGCLAGITRELLLEWCRDAGIEVVEEALPLDVLAHADEVFLTSSIKDVFPVSAVDGRVLPAPGARDGARTRRVGGRRSGRDGPVTPEERRHLLRDPEDEDDWAWRRRIRGNATTRPVYRAVVFVTGLVLVVGGLALVPLPGPGWLIVILGIAVWASEFEPASRLLDFVKEKVRAWEKWLVVQAWWVKVLVGVGTALVVATALWLTMRLTGIPGLVPDSVATWLRDNLGL